MSNTEKRTDIAEKLCDIDSDLILAAAPTGAKKRSTGRIWIASAAALAAAVAVVLTLTFLPKAAGNKPGLTQAEADKPEPAVIENTEEPAPEITAEPDERAVVIPMRAIPIGAASTGEELNEIYIEHGEEIKVCPGAISEASHGDDPWTAPTPQDVLNDPELSSFRDTVTKVEFYNLVFAGTDEYRGENACKVVSVVTLRVKECYKGSLEPGSETTVLIFGGIYSGWTFEPPIGAPGSASHYWNLLAPGVEIIMLAHECTEDDNFNIFFHPCDADDTVLNYRFYYRDLADCYYQRSGGTLFIDDGSRFLYDTEVYDKTMLGEKPSLDSAEAFIIGVINGKAV